MFKLTTKKSLAVKNIVDEYAKTELNTEKIFNMLFDVAKVSNTNFDCLMKCDFHKFIADTFNNLTTKEQKSLISIAKYKNVDLQDCIVYNFNNFGNEDDAYKNAETEKRAVEKILGVINEK